MDEQRGSEKGVEDNIVCSSPSSWIMETVYLYPQYVEDILLVVHSALILYTLIKAGIPRNNII